MAENVSFIINAQNLALTYQLRKSFSLKKIFTKTEINQDIYEIQAVKDVSFVLKEGDNLGIIGVNGSGKSTLLRLLSKTYKPDKGSLEINTEKVQLLTLGAGFMNELTGRENLYLNALLLGISKNDLNSGLANDIIAFSELKEFIDLPMYTYSSGMRSRLTFSVAACIQPDLLLLDEVFSVGDSHFVQKSAKRVCQMVQSDKSVIIISHDIDVIAHNCAKVLWVHKGEKKMFDNTALVISEYNKFILQYSE